jgi:mRNA-degrading endonuclease RelE of RelBE toxin-antitoxin system
MRTVIETPDFEREAARFWDESEHEAFVAWIAQNPDAGDVIPGTNGARKVRWSRSGTGKRGGVRVIYFHRAANGTVILFAIYAKSARVSMTRKEMNRRKP